MKLTIFLSVIKACMLFWIWITASMTHGTGLIAILIFAICEFIQIQLKDAKSGLAEVKDVN